MSAALVELIRSGLVDEIHRGDLAVVSADGEQRFAVGDPARKIAYWRSSAKPFQSMPLIASGAAARLALSTEELALTAASHGGEPVHVALAASLLDHVGHRVEELECGASAPLDAEAAHELARRGVEPTPLHNNCSGQHAACSRSPTSSGLRSRATVGPRIRCSGRSSRTSRASPGSSSARSRWASTAAAFPASASASSTWRSRSPG